MRTQHTIAWRYLMTIHSRILLLSSIHLFPEYQEYSENNVRIIVLLKNIRCTTLLPQFLVDIRGFIVKHWLYIYDSKYCPSLATTFSHLSGSIRESRVEKTAHLLRRSTYRSNFWLLHKNVNANQPGRVPLIEINDSQMEQCLENTAGEVGLPISMFPSMFWPTLRHGVMLQNHFIVSLVVLRPFVCQCSA